MPLTPDEFDAGKRSVVTAIYWFLKSRAPIAFSNEEIMFELGALGVIYALDELDESLNGLEQRGRVESVAVEEKVYYRYPRRVGFRPPTE
jgi:hypothetical protein